MNVCFQRNWRAIESHVLQSKTLQIECNCCCSFDVAAPVAYGVCSQYNMASAPRFDFWCGVCWFVGYLTTLYKPRMLFSVEPGERMIVYCKQEKSREEMIVKFYVC